MGVGVAVAVGVTVEAIVSVGGRGDWVGVGVAVEVGASCLDTYGMYTAKVDSPSCACGRRSLSIRQRPTASPMAASTLPFNSSLLLSFFFTGDLVIWDAHYPVRRPLAAETGPGSYTLMTRPGRCPSVV